MLLSIESMAFTCKYQCIKYNHGIFLRIFKAAPFRQLLLECRYCVLWWGTGFWKRKVLSLKGKDLGKYTINVRNVWLKICSVSWFWQGRKLWTEFESWLWRGGCEEIMSYKGQLQWGIWGLNREIEDMQYTVVHYWNSSGGGICVAWSLLLSDGLITCVHATIP